MSNATVRASLNSKLDSLKNELRYWREIVSGQTGVDGKPHPDFGIFAKHQSQILRLNGFFGGVIESLETSIAGLEDTAYHKVRKVNDSILQGHALWSYYRDKLLQRYSSHLHRYLSAADDFAWACFKPFSEARRAASDGVHAGKVPPLIYLARQVSPYIYPRDWTLEKQIPDVSDSVYAEFISKAPFSVVRLPFYQTTHLPDTMVLAHEMGHVIEMDLGLTDALNAAFDKVPEDEIPAERKATWKRCRVEAFADVFGATVGGLAFCRSLATFLAKDKKTILDDNIGTSKEFAYPTDYLRVLLTLEVLRLRDGQLSPEAAAIEAAWRQEYGKEHPYQSFESDLAAIVTCCVDRPMPELSDKSIKSIANFSKYEDEIALETARRMLSNQQPRVSDPRVIFGATTLAFHQDFGRFDEIEVENIALSKIEAEADKTARSRDGVSEQDLGADRLAGVAMASLLGSDPLIASALIKPHED